MRFRPWSLMVLGWALSTGAFAVEWIGNPGIAVSLDTIYTDNVCQSSENQRGKLLAAVGLSTAPSGSIRGRGSRSSFDLSGSVQVNTLSDSQLNDDDCFGGSNGGNEQFAPNLFANGSLTLVENLLNINATGRAAQNAISPYLGAGGDPYGGNGNTNTYYRYSVGPVLNHRIRGKGIVNMQYTFDEIINSSDAVSDSTSDAVVASLTNDSSSQISWKWQANYRRVQYSDANLTFANSNNVLVVPREDTVLKSAGLTLGYQIDRYWQVNGTYGWEWNDFQTYNNTNTGGNAWKFGVRWTPSQRTTVSLGMGDRFFGKTPSVNISHRRKRSEFTLSYNRGITFARDIRTQDNLLNPDFNFDSTLNTSSPIIDERLTLGYTYTGRRATLTASGSYSDQTQEDTGEKSAYRGIAVTVSPQISSVYTLSGTLAWTEDEPQRFFGVPTVGPSSAAQNWTATVQLSRSLTERMNLSLGYQFTDQQSNDSFSGYQENRIIASVTYSL